MLNISSIKHLEILDPVHIEREHCGLENGYETHLLEASEATLLDVSGAIKINVLLSKRCR